MLSLLPFFPSLPPSFPLSSSPLSPAHTDLQLICDFLQAPSLEGRGTFIFGALVSSALQSELGFHFQRKIEKFS